jgi:hypothetical protein
MFLKEAYTKSNNQNKKAQKSWPSVSYYSYYLLFHIMDMLKSCFSYSLLNLYALTF